MADGISDPTSEQVISAGPTYTVVFEHAAGVDRYDLWLKSDDLATLFSSTRFNPGGGTSFSQAVDFFESKEGVFTNVPGDTVDLTVGVDIYETSGPGAPDATYSVPIQLQCGIPAVSALTPLDGSVVETGTITAAWTYGDSQANPQAELLVELDDSQGFPVYTSLWVQSAVASHAVDLDLVDGETYTLKVRVRNDQGAVS